MTTPATALVTDQDTQLPGELSVNVEALSSRVTELAIASPEARERACETLTGVLELKDEIVAFFEPMRQKTHEAYQAVLAAKRSKLEPVEACEVQLRAKIGQYDLERERARRRLEEDTRNEELRRAQDERNRQAARAEQEGKPIIAEAIRSAPVTIAPLVVPEVPIAPTSNGSKVGSRVEHTFRITDPNLVPREYCCPDERAIKALVKARNGNVQIPGVEVYQVGDVTVRKAKK